jgi:hypothetical protein
MKQFNLIEDNKTLAEGIIFSDGRVAVRWLGEHSSIVMWNSFEDFNKVSVSIRNRELIYLC